MYKEVTIWRSAPHIRNPSSKTLQLKNFNMLFEYSLSLAPPNWGQNQPDPTNDKFLPRENLILHCVAQGKLKACLEGTPWANMLESRQQTNCESPPTGIDRRPIAARRHALPEASPPACPGRLWNSLLGCIMCRICDTATYLFTAWLPSPRIFHGICFYFLYTLNSLRGFLHYY